MIDLGKLRIAEASPQLLDWGAVAKPILGGVSQRLRRIGARHTIEVRLAPMPIEAEGRRMIARLMQAKQLGARLRWPQVDFAVGACGSPVVRTAVTGGMTLSVTGGQAGYSFREGQWVSITHSARSYLYAVTAGIALGANGVADIPLNVPLRSALTVGDAVEVAAPVIEGWIEGDGFGWTIDAARTVGLSFAITERA